MPVASPESLAFTIHHPYHFEANKLSHTTTEVFSACIVIKQLITIEMCTLLNLKMTVWTAKEMSCYIILLLKKCVYAELRIIIINELINFILQLLNPLCLGYFRYGL